MDVSKEFKKEIKPWVEGLVGKAFLWQKLTRRYQNGAGRYQDGTGIPRPIDPNLEDGLYRPRAKEVQTFLRALLPKKLSDGRDLHVPGDQTDPDGQRAESGKARRIQKLTRNCDQILRKDYAEERIEVAAATNLSEEERSYMRALESTDCLGSHGKEDLQKYPTFLLDHYAFKPLKWNKIELEIALDLKDVLGWPNEFTPGFRRNSWFLPHPVTGRLIAGEIAIVKEMALTKIAVELLTEKTEKGHPKLRLKPDFEKRLVSGSHLADVKALLLCKPWTSESYKPGEPVLANQHPWATWGRTEYTNDIPDLLARYKYEPILLEVSKNPLKDLLGQRELIGLVEEFVQQCNDFIVHHQYLQKCVADTGLQHLIKLWRDIVAKINEAKPVECENLDDPLSGSFFDLQILPDICLFEEAIYFLNQALLHTLMHSDQSIRSSNDAKGEGGTFCVICKSFVNETEKGKFDQYRDQVPDEDFRIPSDVLKLIENRSSYIPAWAW